MSGAEGRANSPWRLFGAAGPGLVLAVSVLGPGDFVSNSASGAAYGYTALWALALGIGVRYILLRAAARYTLVTGETMLEGYARVGRWAVWFVLASALLKRHLSNAYLTLLMGSAIAFLAPLPAGDSAFGWSLAFVAIGFTVAFRGGYQGVELLCKPLIVVMGAAYAAGALLSKPDPVEIVTGALSPSLPGGESLYGAFLVVTAIVGGTAGSFGNISYAYFLREKGWRGPEALSKQRLDLFVSLAALFIMGALLQIAAAAAAAAGAATRLETPEDLIALFSRTHGAAGRAIFSLGLWATVFSSYVGANTGYALMVTDIYRGFLTRGAAAAAGRTREDPVYRLLICAFCASPLYILWTGVRPLWLVLTVASLFVIVLPVMALVLLRLTADRRLMGAYVNGWPMNLALGSVFAVTLYLAVNNAVELAQSFVP